MKENYTFRLDYTTELPQVSISGGNRSWNTYAAKGNETVYIKNDNSEFTVENVISDTSVNVPLRAYVLIGKSIKLKLQYSSHYSKETVSDMLGRFVNIAENGIENQLIRNIKLLRKEYV